MKHCIPLQVLWSYTDQHNSLHLQKCGPEWVYGADGQQRPEQFGRDEHVIITSAQWDVIWEWRSSNRTKCVFIQHQGVLECPQRGEGLRLWNKTLALNNWRERSDISCCHITPLLFFKATLLYPGQRCMSHITYIKLCLTVDTIPGSKLQRTGTICPYQTSN